MALKQSTAYEGSAETSRWDSRCRATRECCIVAGRPAIEAALKSTGMADPARDRPFLTTRELCILKLDRWPALAQRYLAANQRGQRALLSDTVDAGPLPALASVTRWTKPRGVDGLEWFASAGDICRVYASLAALSRRPELLPIAHALEINDGGLGLDPAHWKTTWFKGGSEPGVLTVTYRATTRNGHSYVVAVLAENPSAPIDGASATPTLLSARSSSRGQPEGGGRNSTSCSPASATTASGVCSSSASIATKRS